MRHLMKWNGQTVAITGTIWVESAEGEKFPVSVDELTPFEGADYGPANRDENQWIRLIWDGRGGWAFDTNGIWPEDMIRFVKHGLHAMMHDPRIPQEK